MDYSAAFNTGEKKEQTQSSGGLSQEKQAELHQIMKRDPMDADQFLKSFSQFSVQLAGMREQAEALQVTDDQSSASCAEMASQCRVLVNAVNKKVKEINQPHIDFTTTIRTAGKRITDPSTELQRYLEGKNHPYLIEKERQRREAEAKARAEAERIRQEQERQRRKAAEDARKAEEEGREPPPPPEPVIPVVASAPQTETKLKSDFGSQKVERKWVFEIIDLRLLPDECYLARKKQITEAVKPWINAQMTAGIREIPGCRIFEQDFLKTRAK